MTAQRPIYSSPFNIRV